MTRLAVVGDALLDRDLDGRAQRLAPDAPVPVVDAIEERPRPGGAALAAVLAAADGHDVTLVCALGADAAGDRLRGLLEAVGVRICDLGLRGATPEKVRVRASGQALVRLDLGGESRTCGPCDEAVRTALAGADAVLVSDYGRGVSAEPGVRAALESLPATTPIVWDPHPRGADPVPGVLLVTPNAAEAAAFAGSGGDEPFAAAEDAGRALARRWQAVDVCVTLGARGALLIGGDGPALAIPAPPVAAGDPCGAGDRFAATAAGRLADGALPSEAARAAVEAASAFVAAGGASAVSADAGPARRRRFARREDAGALARRIRSAGGTVVATGGCFDLLHAGHVRMLAAARALGDCLIVCLNADASVRRLKGDERPVVSEDDRAAVLAGLRCVDAVAVFAEDEPSAVLRELRPHLWVKGGDYAVADLPERAVLGEWGGRAVTVPYLAGRSTSNLIERTTTRER
ncbi:MAG: D-beta-D-heptose 7-phosphate kinase / D-beta-D-heptose 1-phosphate adenosyltransferase [Baekduia sp.]|nr:D-beta-D-heptose 7-phosphate kinase / D-beta-D-heptose 1-phosphate adenosyltransferase [Baekduia sp.]